MAAPCAEAGVSRAILEACTLARGDEARLRELEKNQIDPFATQLRDLTNKELVEIRRSLVPLEKGDGDKPADLGRKS